MAHLLVKKEPESGIVMAVQSGVIQCCGLKCMPVEFAGGKESAGSRQIDSYHA